MRENFGRLVDYEPKYRRNIVAPINRQNITDEDIKAGRIPEHVISRLVGDTHKSVVWFPKTEWKGKTYEAQAFCEEGGERYVPILWMHGGDFARWVLPIGSMDGDWKMEGDGRSVDNVWTVNSRFHAEEKTDTAVNAANIYKLIIEGHLKMFSIGFDAELEILGEDVNEFFEAMGRPERYPDIRSVLLGIILYEYSVVTWGANPGAHLNDDGRKTLVKQFRSAMTEDFVSQKEFDKLSNELQAFKSLLSPEVVEKLRAMNILKDL